MEMVTNELSQVLMSQYQGNLTEGELIECQQALIGFFEGLMEMQADQGSQTYECQ